MNKNIIAEARTWLGTAFCHQGRVKISERSKGACDCLGLVIEVSRALGLTTKDGKAFYLQDHIDYHSIPDSKKLAETLDKCLTRVEVPQAGDLGLFSFLA